ncbi:MAG: hypothetical protein HGN29_06430 [Asgard group archaeon]|nr:hypothetical protein [Asgard group archaeon]
MINEKNHIRKWGVNKEQKKLSIILTSISISFSVAFIILFSHANRNLATATVTVGALTLASWFITLSKAISYFKICESDSISYNLYLALIIVSAVFLALGGILLFFGILLFND